MAERTLDFVKIILIINRARSTTSEYEVVRTESGYNAALYDGCWQWRKDITREECVFSQGTGTERSYRNLAETLYRLGVQKWDGFHKSNPRALDGEMFLLEIFLPDGKKIRAEGSNAYPKNYRALVKALDEAACGPLEY